MRTLRPLGAILLAAACQSPPPPARTGMAEEVFEETRRVVLDDAPVATIGQPNDILPYRDGLLVADARYRIDGVP